MLEPTAHPDKQTAILTLRLVNEAMGLIVRQYDPFYTQIWTSLTAVQQKTLLALIQESGARLHLRRWRRPWAKEPQQCSTREALTDKEILREEEHAGGLKMSLKIPSYLSGHVRNGLHRFPNALGSLLGSGVGRHRWSAIVAATASTGAVDDGTGFELRSERLELQNRNDLELGILRGWPLGHVVARVLICSLQRIAVAEVLVTGVVDEVILTVAPAKDSPLLVVVGGGLVGPLNDGITASLDATIIETFSAADVEQSVVAGAEADQIPLLIGIAGGVVGILDHGRSVRGAAVGVEHHARAAGRADDFIESGGVERCGAGFGGCGRRS